MAKILLIAAAIVLAGVFVWQFDSKGPEASGRDASKTPEVDKVNSEASAELPEIVFPPPAVFDHDLHVEDLEIDCADCHHETLARPLDTPHEQYFEDLWINCQTCHHDGDGDLQPQSCSNCHRKSAGGIADLFISEKVAIHESCWECHDSGTGAEASESCSFCHPAPDD